MNFTVLIDWKFVVALAQQCQESSSQRRWILMQLKEYQPARLMLARSMRLLKTAAARPYRS